MGIGRRKGTRLDDSRRPNGLLRATWPLLLALALGPGCWTNPAGPVETGGGAGWSQSPPVEDPLVLTTVSGTADFVTAPTDSATELALETLKAAEGLLPLPDGGLVASAEIDGAKGGTLHAGRFTVTVPRGAYTGTATITCRLPDSTLMLCDLEISPSTTDRFAVPVVLSLDTGDLPVDNGTLSIFWYDPSVAAWRAMPTTVDSGAKWVSTALGHFSRYCGGKAGW